MYDLEKIHQVSTNHPCVFSAFNSVLIGFPPKPLFGEPNNALSSLNIRSGETIIVEEDASALLSIPVQVVPSSVQSNSSSTAISNQASAAAANNHQNPIDVNDGVAVRREIPSDNSWYMPKLNFFTTRDSNCCRSHLTCDNDSISINSQISAYSMHLDMYIAAQSPRHLLSCVSSSPESS
jgi:hypothetical protein